MEKIILLHAALGAADQMQEMNVALADDFEVHTFNFSGHGGKPFNENGFNVETFSAELKDFIVANELQGSHLLGYSMGGYVALHFAGHHPTMVRSIITYATKFLWNRDTALSETDKLNTQKMLLKVPAFAEQLKQRHAPNNWIEVVERTKKMMMEMGETPLLTDDFFAALEVPVLLLVGDKDRMISVAETHNAFSKIAKAQMGVIPNCAHPMEHSNMDALCYLASQFLQS